MQLEYLSNSECARAVSNLCHWVQHPWKLTGRDFWSTRNKGKPLYKEKCVLTKCCWAISEMANARECMQVISALVLGGPLPKVGSSVMSCVLLFMASLLWYWGDFWSSRNTKESHFLSNNVFWENAVGYLRDSKCENVQTLAIGFSTPENLLEGNFWNSRK